MKIGVSFKNILTKEVNCCKLFIKFLSTEHMNKQKKKNDNQEFLKKEHKTQNQFSNNHYVFTTEEPGKNESAFQKENRGY